MIIFALLAIVLGLLLAARPVGRGTLRTLPPAAEPPAEEPTAEPPAPPRPLRLGDTFSRAEIRALLGGSVRETFPHVDGHVVAGCFHPGYHPYAPFVVLPGWGPGIRRWAELLADEGEAIPCFLMRGASAWEYVGRFRVAQLSDDADEVTEWARIAEREGDVSMVLHLEAATDEGGGAEDAPGAEPA
jgi:hypothetical protein